MARTLQATRRCRRDLTHLPGAIDMMGAIRSKDRRLPHVLIAGVAEME